jgi:hypothetical protein
LTAQHLRAAEHALDAAIGIDGAGDCGRLAGRESGSSAADVEQREQKQSADAQ